MFDKIEIIVFEIHKLNSKPLAVVLVYKPPDQNHNEFLAHFQDSVRVLDHENKEIYILWRFKL